MTLKREQVMDQHSPDLRPPAADAEHGSELGNAIMSVGKCIWGSIILGLVGLATGGPLGSLLGAMVGGIAALFVSNDFLMRAKHQLRL